MEVIRTTTFEAQVNLGLVTFKLTHTRQTKEIRKEERETKPRKDKKLR